MAQHRTNESGIVPLLIMIILIVVLVVAVGSWYLSTRSASKSDETATVGADEGHKKASQEVTGGSILQLAGKTIRLTLPEKWTHTQGTDECPANATVDLVCLEGAIITPGTQLPTRYSNGTEYFNVQVGVFENAAHRVAKDWLIQDFDDGESSDQDIVSSTAINGYDTYYRKKKMSGDGTTIEEVSYVFSRKSKVVLIKARVYEPGTLADGRQVGDFRKFEPAINQMARSLALDP